jgi:hypothetical protein
MTIKQQRRLYFPAWHPCAKANEWTMARGRLKADLIDQARNYAGSWPPEVYGLYETVLNGAGEFAKTHHRGVIAEDLRHACNVVAGGRLHSADLSNKQTSRVVVLFRLLTDPWDLDAMMEWLDPVTADKKSFLSFLRRIAHEGKLRAISRNAFGTEEYEPLEPDQLRWICKQVAKRA